MYGYNWQNPYMNQVNQMNQPYQQNQMNMPKTSVKKVTGIEGANMYPMAPDSSEILVDNNSDVIYLVTTDSAGLKTVKPFTISPVVEQPKIDVSSFEDRLKRLEEIVNAKSDSSSTRSKKSE